MAMVTRRRQSGARSGQAVVARRRLPGGCASIRQQWPSGSGRVGVGHVGWGRAGIVVGRDEQGSASGGGGVGWGRAGVGVGRWRRRVGRCWAGTSGSAIGWGGVERGPAGGGERGQTGGGQPGELAAKP
uniref:Uncharacterized protein n=1 Tax=Oryza rufipogon TaxID=4529 RepID=A0A0E0PZH3_ORYRU